VADEIHGVTSGTLSAYYAALAEVDKKRKEQGLEPLASKYAMVQVPYAVAGRRYGDRFAVPGGGPRVVRSGRLTTAGEEPYDVASPRNNPLVWRNPTLLSSQIPDYSPHWYFDIKAAMRAHRKAFRPSFSVRPSFAMPRGRWSGASVRRTGGVSF